MAVSARRSKAPRGSRASQISPPVSTWKGRSSASSIAPPLQCHAAVETAFAPCAQPRIWMHMGTLRAIRADRGEVDLRRTRH